MCDNYVYASLLKLYERLDLCTIYIEGNAVSAKEACGFWDEEQLSKPARLKNMMIEYFIEEEKRWVTTPYSLKAEHDFTARARGNMNPRFNCRDEATLIDMKKRLI